MNDNQSPELEAFTKTISTMDAQTKLTCLLSLIEAGCEIQTAFVKDNADVFTHQMLKLSCGDYSTLSQPELLPVPLIPFFQPKPNEVN